MSKKKGNGWPDILKAALVGYEAERRRIEEKMAAVRAELSRGWGRGRRSEAAAFKSKKRVLSAAARKRIGAAQKKRWAQLKRRAMGEDL